MSGGRYNPHKSKVVIKRAIGGAYNVEIEQRHNGIVSFRRIASFPSREQAEAHKRLVEVGRA